MTGKSTIDFGTLARFVAATMEVSGQEKIDDLAVFMRKATKNMKDVFGGGAIPPEQEPATPIPDNSRNRKRAVVDPVRTVILGCINDAIFKSPTFSTDDVLVQNITDLFQNRTLAGKDKKDAIISALKILYQVENAPY